MTDCIGINVIRLSANPSVCVLAGRGPCAPPPVAGNLLAVSLRNQSADWLWQSASPLPPSRAAGPTDLALPLGELSQKVTERACRAGPMSAHRRAKRKKTAFGAPSVRKGLQ